MGLDGVPDWRLLLSRSFEFQGTHTQTYGHNVLKLVGREIEAKLGSAISGECEQVHRSTCRRSV